MSSAGSIVSNASTSETSQQAPQGLKAAIRYAKGVGPARASLLKRLGVETLEDLLALFPRRYEDRAHIKDIAFMTPGQQETFLGSVLTVRLQRFRRGMSLVQIAVGDDTGIVYGAWFNQPYMKDRFKEGDRLYLFGRVQIDRKKKPVIYNPEYEFVAPEESSIHMGRIVPIYPLTEGLQQRVIRSIQWQMLEQTLSQVQEDLPEDLIRRMQWMEKKEALKQIHFPDSFALQAQARERLAYEELFYFQLALAVRKNKMKQTPRGFLHQTRGAKTLAFLKSLPFKLTRAQERVINQVRHDMASPFPMNRLIQGDVGCGKTAVATAAAMISLDSACQTAFMVPTEILAEQHFRSLQKFLKPMGVRIGLLLGDLDSKEKRDLLKQVADGAIDVLVGTHALIQESVVFKKLGLVIIDEQHKFGVVQREKLRRKGVCPDVLVMTATPIPRTLALTLYGDLEESAIDELPPGRQRITTYWVSSKKLASAYEFIRKEVRLGHQAFVVYPLVEDSPKVSSKAVLTMAKNLSQKVFPDLRVGLVHGKLAGDEKDAIMREFEQGRIQVLVCTSVVEVGIDVPNATCMVVENAERFGLAQLHQMRGRIGRGAFASTFIMVGEPTTGEGVARMKVLKDSQDGFRIAEEDLKIRGPGEFFGVRQHGMPELKVASLVTDRPLLEMAYKDAAALIKKDANLIDPSHRLMADTLRGRYKGLLTKISVG